MSPSTPTRSRSRVSKAQPASKARRSRKGRAAAVVAPSSPGRHRHIEPGAVWFITKKCTDDLFLIRPDPVINQILLYALVLKAVRHGVLVHGYCFMSNHFHLVVTDVRGTLPAFMKEFLNDTSRAIQAAKKDDRPIWRSRPYHPTRLLDLDAAERKIAYTILNPTRAGVTEPQEWPGLISDAGSFGSAISARRPDVYFSPRYRPDEVSMTLEPVAPSFAEDDEPVMPRTTARRNARSAARILEAVDATLAQLRRARRRQGRSLAGPRSVRSTSRKKRGERRVRERAPRFATLDRELLETALEREVAFEYAHAEAKAHYLEGKRNTLFPPGTYGYRVLLGVRVAKGGAAA